MVNSQFRTLKGEGEGPVSYSTRTVSSILGRMLVEAVDRWVVDGIGEFMANGILIQVDEDCAVSIQVRPVETFVFPDDED